MSVEKLGVRIRKYREERKMTREDLAAAADVQLAVITALEDSDLCPSIAPLQKIARALNVRLGTFMDDQVSTDPLVVRKASREADLTMQKADDKRPAFRFHSLGKGKTDRNMEPFFVEISPEPEEDRKLSSHQGEEFIVVVSGKLQIIYGKEEYILEAGDSIYYNSIVPHYAGAAGDGPAEIYAVIYYP
ncbi:XRE family transcriptional regulator [Desulfovibrio subterraneus]|jgi:transcriptional regulator with XRE-family HTH domain|uniref:DNA-binding protein n=1 Tax=Desulfovibrio subterraneus TaxID=2718620 RepID=A0A7J0BH56_9BACT|nr:XRE family transcriptional regulator [Desulfovibrio subterraneus]WBF66804.1 XRE family transcriptional regulator [Desulfovibrio subterraneus]GFM32522.1 DNA-binding protein [Desulfovibrio subterraneus]